MPKKEISNDEFLKKYEAYEKESMEDFIKKYSSTESELRETITYLIENRQQCGSATHSRFKKRAGKVGITPGEILIKISKPQTTRRFSRYNKRRRISFLASS